MSAAATACVLWGNACNLVSSETAAPGGGRRSFSPNRQAERRFSINGVNDRRRRRRWSEIRSGSSNSDRDSEESGSEKTNAVGTLPGLNRRWTGYVEKDTAGQKNIYSVEPDVYVAESAISSGSAGDSEEGVENTMAIVAGIALISIAAASSILLHVGKNKPPVVEYSGPSLSYYINKLKSDENVRPAPAPAGESAEPALPREESFSPAPEVSPVEIPADQLPESSPTSS
ncbi:unnamed protein product [Cuscuta campestris]|uniref:Uncharacterized protein n=1 Tax=Cuscuta campestris TaxID=132261 RepID=A0A484KT09_9ASTE|nr:unnamed protein product [Cuscuta campestris]